MELILGTTAGTGSRPDPGRARGVSRIDASREKPAWAWAGTWAMAIGQNLSVSDGKRPPSTHWKAKPNCINSVNRSSPLLEPRTADRRPVAAVLTCLFLVSAGASGCKPAAVATTPLKRVQLVEVRQQTLPSSVTYQSTVTAIHEIPMSPEIDGRIVAMPMREGQIVKAGTLLYTLDQLPLESQAKADQAVAENARLNALRFVGANFSGAVSNKESADYVATAKQTQEIFRSRKATLAYKYVRAPIDGQLGAINNKLGDYVTAGTAVTNLVDNSRIWISIDVPAALG